MEEYLPAGAPLSCPRLQPSGEAVRQWNHDGVDKTGLLQGCAGGRAPRKVRAQPWWVADDTLWLGELIGAQHLDADEGLIPSTQASCPGGMV